MKKLFEVLSGEPLSTHQICIRAGMDARTVNKYLEMIVLVQASEKVVAVRDGLRFVYKKQQNLV